MSRFQLIRKSASYDKTDNEQCLTGKTTNMETYPAHPPQERPKPREKEKYYKPTEKMNVTSVHRF